MSKQDIEKRLGFAAQGVKETTRTNVKAAFDLTGNELDNRIAPTMHSLGHFVEVQAPRLKQDIADAAKYAKKAYDLGKQIMQSATASPETLRAFDRQVSVAKAHSAWRIANRENFSRPGVKAKMALTIYTVGAKNACYEALANLGVLAKLASDTKSGWGFHVTVMTDHVKSAMSKLESSPAQAGEYLERAIDTLGMLRKIDPVRLNDIQKGSLKQLIGYVAKSLRDARANIKVVTTASRPGVKAKFDTKVGSKGNKSAMIAKNGPDADASWLAWVVQHHGEGQGESVLGTMRSYSTEARAKAAALRGLETSGLRGGFARPGVKAKFAKPQFRTKKLHNGYIAVEVNQGNGWERYDTTHEESWNGIEEYERGYQKAYDRGLRYSGGAWRIPSTTASRPGVKAKMGRAEKVLSDGSVSLDFTEAKEWLSTVSDEALKYIISDSNAAAKAMGSGGKKFNYYTDLALTAAQMLRSTKRGGHRLNSSRPSAKAKMENSDGNYFMISGYVDNSILGNRTFDTQAEAEYYGKRMLESLKKDNPKAKDVNVQISKVIKYSPQTPFKTLSLRPGAKAKA